MQNYQLELVIGQNLANELVKDNAAMLIESIRGLREERDYIIPLIRITDEISIDKDSYEIRDLNKVILEQSTVRNKEQNIVIKEIVRDLDKVCMAI